MINIDNIKDDTNVLVQCINPTKLLVENKIYEVVKISCANPWFHKPFERRNAFKIKINDYLIITVSPKRFKILKVFN